MTFIQDTVPFPAVSRAEYESAENGEMTQEQIVRDLMSQTDLTYKLEDGERYYPRQDSMYRRGKYHQRYYVNYSFPVGANSPVASMWTCTGEGSDEYLYPIHIDLAKVMELLVTYYKQAGYKVPPAKES